MVRVIPTSVCVALALLGTPASQAQTSRASVLVATVAIDSSRVLLPGAEVVISDLRRSARSDILGNAVIPNLAPGTHVVRVRAFGYAAVEATLLFPGDTVAVTFYLKPVAASLAPVQVSAERVARGLDEFEARRAMRIGRFLTEKQLDSASTTDFQTFMAIRFPGLTVIPLANGERVLGSLRGSCGADLSRTGLPGERGIRGGAPCTPNLPCPVPVILDGQDIHDATSDIVRLWDLAGVEFYSGSEVPVRYRVSGYGCGVLILWSRRD